MLSFRETTTTSQNKQAKPTLSAGQFKQFAQHQDMLAFPSGKRPRQRMSRPFLAPGAALRSVFTSARCAKRTASRSLSLESNGLDRERGRDGYGMTPTNKKHSTAKPHKSKNQKQKRNTHTHTTKPHPHKSKTDSTKLQKNGGMTPTNIPKPSRDVLESQHKQSTTGHSTVEGSNR